MTGKETIFLSLEEAIAAVCFDFRQYGPQILLYAEIIRVASDGRTTTKKDTRQQGVWIGESGRHKMIWMQGIDLIDYMCEIVKTVGPDAEKLAAVCARVFQSHVFPDIDPESGHKGIRIDTGMDTYRCRQCGQCCRYLDYHKEVTADDVDRWEKYGRSDILEWVGRSRNSSGKTVYQIWMIPGTRQLSEKCPFLYKVPTENRWICKIQDLKPAICRNYPVSRKHARMTGCPGFETG